MRGEFDSLDFLYHLYFCLQSFFAELVIHGCFLELFVNLVGTVSFKRVSMFDLMCSHNTSTGSEIEKDVVKFREKVLRSSKSLEWFLLRQSKNWRQGFLVCLAIRDEVV